MLLPSGRARWEPLGEAEARIFPGTDLRSRGKEENVPVEPGSENNGETDGIPVRAFDRNLTAVGPGYASGNGQAHARSSCF